MINSTELIAFIDAEIEAIEWLKKHCASWYEADRFEGKKEAFREVKNYIQGVKAKQEDTPLTDLLKDEPIL